MKAKHLVWGAATAAGLTALAYFWLTPRRRRLYPTAEALLALPEPEALTTRFVPLATAVNLRDIGGYPGLAGRRVRWGQVYRSGSLAALSPADVAALEALQLRWVCDLRTAREAEGAPDRLPADPTVRYEHRPAYVSAQTGERLRTLLFRRHELDAVMTEGYTRLADRRAPVFGELLHDLADPARRPALVHCTAGKDRTGIVIAFLLHLLGVSEAVILADYALTNAHYDRLLHAAREDMRRMARIGITENEARPVMTANPAYLQGLFDHLRARYGSVDAYLYGPAGVTEALTARLRAELLD